MKIVIGILVIIAIAVVFVAVYLWYLTEHSPSVLGRGYDREEQNKK